MEVFYLLSIRIGSAKRSELSASSTIPGPGAYQQRSRIGEGPKYAMRPKTAIILRDEKPGPGQYTPTKDAVTRRPPSAVAGKERRKGFGESKGVPGPGAYMYFSTLRVQPAFSFGTGKAITHDSGTPGPGAYKLPATIPNLPNYARPEKSKEFQYV